MGKAAITPWGVTVSHSDGKNARRHFLRCHSSQEGEQLPTARPCLQGSAVIEHEARLYAVRQRRLQ